MKPLKISTLLLTSVLIAGICQAQTADGIINNYLKKIGGADNWRSLQTVTMKANMTLQGMDIAGIIYSKRPNKHKSVFDVMGKKVVNAYDGQDVWMINPFMGDSTPQIVPEEQAKIMKQNNFDSEFLDYADKGYTVEYVGQDTVDGKPAYEIKLTKKDGDIEYHYFDEQSYLPVMMKGFVSSGPQKGAEADIYFNDFRPVGKLLFPFEMETRTNGSTVQQVNFSDIELNNPMDDSMFAFPKN